MLSFSPDFLPISLVAPSYLACSWIVSFPGETGPSLSLFSLKTTPIASSHTFIQQVFIKHLLCKRHCSQALWHHSKQPYHMFIYMLMDPNLHFQLSSFSWVWDLYIHGYTKFFYQHIENSDTLNSIVPPEFFSWFLLHPSPPQKKPWTYSLGFLSQWQFSNTKLAKHAYKAIYLYLTFLSHKWKVAILPKANYL